MNKEYYKKYEPIFSSWYLKKMLGEGSYGKVFEIVREDFGTQYKAALKAITIPQSESEIRSVMADGMDEKSVIAYYKNFVEEIVSEFVLMSKLKGNSNVVSYEDHVVLKHDNDIGWDILIRMELLTPLIDHIRNISLTRKDVIKLGIDMCRALELCQKYNIIHRDIKPENIFVSENGDYKLGDFGIARTLEQTSGMLSKKGTQAYMAPEIYREESYGSNVDIYSLGIVMYRLLNENRTPFLPAYPAPITHNDREAAIKKRISGAKLSAPANADGRLAEIVLKACEYNPSERYFAPMEMREELEAILYNKEEAKIIYPKGDDAPIKSIQYLKTGDEIPKIDPQNKTEDLIADKEIPKDKTEGVFGAKNASEKTESDFTTRDDDRFDKTESQFTSRDKGLPVVEKPFWKKKSTVLVASGIVVLGLTIGGFSVFKPASAPVSVVSASKISNPATFIFEPSATSDEKTNKILKSRLSCFDLPYAFENNSGKIKAIFSKDVISTDPVDFIKQINMIGKPGNIVFESNDGTVILTNDDIKTAVSKTGKADGSNTEQDYAEITLTEEGQKKFSEATERISALTDGNNFINFSIDGELIQKINVQSAVNTGVIIITPQMADQIANTDTNKVLLSIGMTAYAANNELNFNKSIVNLIVVIITDGKLPEGIKITIDDSVAAMLPTPSPTTEPTVEWRLEGYEDAPPYKEFERKFVNGNATEETRYTGNQKPQDTSVNNSESENKSSGGGASKPSSGSSSVAGASKPSSDSSSGGGTSKPSSGSSSSSEAQSQTPQQAQPQQPETQQPSQPKGDSDKPKTYAPPKRVGDFDDY